MNTKKLLLLGAVALGGFLLLSRNSPAQSNQLAENAQPFSTAPSTPYLGLSPQLFSIDLAPKGNDQTEYLGYLANQQNALAQQNQQLYNQLGMYQQQLNEYYASGGGKEDYSMAPAYDAPHEQKAFSMLGQSEKDYEVNTYSAYVKSSGGKSGSMKDYQKFKVQKLAEDIKQKQISSSPSKSKTLKSVLSSQKGVNFIFGKK